MDERLKKILPRNVLIFFIFLIYLFIYLYKKILSRYVLILFYLCAHSYIITVGVWVCGYI
jgi:hypothetical protein